MTDHLPAAHFGDRVIERCKRIRAPLCAGFDPDPDLIPRPLFAKYREKHPAPAAMRALLTDLYVEALDVLAPLVAAVKPNAAFFEQFGSVGTEALAAVSAAARARGIPLILDAKRGDIDSTARAYARAVFEGCSVENQRFAGLAA